MGTQIDLAVDQDGRFLRVFVSCGASVAVQGHLLPILGFDGTHCKSDKYNGVILTLIGRDGQGKNFPLAFALVPVESEDHVMWFFESCHASKITFEKIPVFCDRGKIVQAANRLNRERGINLNLKFCTVHIARNVKQKFGARGRHFENAIWAIQATATPYEYDKAVLHVRSTYGDDVAEYVAAIDPVHWVVFANNETQFGSGPFQPSSLFSWRSTNFVESENGALLRSGGRDGSPFHMLKKAMETSMDAFRVRQLNSAKWLAAGLTITPHARTMLRQQEKLAGEYSVKESSAIVYFVSRAGHDKYRRVDTSVPRCSCETHQHFKVPCRHIIAALQYRREPRKILEAFAPQYRTTVYSKAFADASVELVIDEVLEKDDTVAPAPRYRQAGSGRRQDRRIRSAGEGSGGKVYVCRSCQEQDGHNRRTCKKHGDTVPDNSALVPCSVAISDNSAVFGESERLALNFILG